uniref:CMP/dCMP-type deaminase domain-containing protein n=1 Tax=Parastrongyloides trichosuri TaxID=131310 RepID=A0A0N4ZLF5_PARTI
PKPGPKPNPKVTTKKSTNKPLTKPKPSAKPNPKVTTKKTTTRITTRTTKKIMTRTSSKRLITTTKQPIISTKNLPSYMINEINKYRKLHQVGSLVKNIFFAGLVYKNAKQIGCGVTEGKTHICVACIISTSKDIQKDFKDNIFKRKE